MSFNHADDPSGIMSCDDGLVDVGAKTIVSGVGESSAWTNPVSSSTSPSFDALISFTIGDGNVNGNVHVGDNGILDGLGSWASELNVYRDDDDVNAVCNTYSPTSPFPTSNSRAQSPIVSTKPVDNATTVKKPKSKKTPTRHVIKADFNGAFASSGAMATVSDDVSMHEEIQAEFANNLLLGKVVPLLDKLMSAQGPDDKKESSEDDHSADRLASILINDMLDAENPSQPACEGVVTSVKKNEPKKSAYKKTRLWRT